MRSVDALPRARIRWLTKEEGGRESTPTGPSYSTVARFEARPDRWPSELRSVALAITAAADSNGVMLVGISLLFPEGAPAGLLTSGSRFELYEGKKTVALGEVI